MTDRHRMAGFQKPMSGITTKEVGLAVVSITDSGAASCSCGWRHVMVREKVLNSAIDRHVNKRHDGRAIYL